jgi:hypothetical protein
MTFSWERKEIEKIMEADILACSYGPSDSSITNLVNFSSKTSYPLYYI